MGKSREAEKKGREGGAEGPQGPVRTPKPEEVRGIVVRARNRRGWVGWRKIEEEGKVRMSLGGSGGRLEKWR